MYSVTILGLGHKTHDNALSSFNDSLNYYLKDNKLIHLSNIIEIKTSKDTYFYTAVAVLENEPL